MGVFEDLLSFKVLTIRYKLPKWMKEEKFELITSEHTFFDTNKIILHSDSGSSGEFILSYVKAIRKKFKCE